MQQLMMPAKSRSDLDCSTLMNDRPNEKHNRIGRKDCQLSSIELLDSGASFNRLEDRCDAPALSASVPFPVCASPRHPAVRRFPRWRVGLVWAVVFCGAAVAKAQTTLVTVDGAPRAAELRSVKDGAATFKGNEGEFSAKLEEIASWGAPREASGAQVVLADGSVLVAELTAIEADRLSVVSPTLGAVAIPLTQLAAYVAHPPTDPWRRDQLVERLLHAEGENDQLLLENGDELRGTLVSCDGVTIQWDAKIGKAEGSRVETPLESVAAIVFNPALRARVKAGTPRTWLGLDDGSLLLAGEFSFVNNRLSLTRPDGATWEASALAGTSPLVLMQPLDGQAHYLSDLEPEAYRHLPYLSREWPYQLDRTVSGARLRAGGRLYAKGIGMHSASRLTFPVGGAYRRFDAEVAIDDEAAGGGSVVLRVFADATEKYRSPVLRGGEKPVAISVDIAGAQRVSLVVDHADRGDQLDRADWLDVRVVK